MTALRVEVIGGNFGQWEELLGMIRDSFAYMDGVIDPPSSAGLLTAENLRQKAEEETGFAAFLDGRLSAVSSYGKRPTAFISASLPSHPLLREEALGDC
ncbi:hypothetical protein FHW20_002628 [Ochrobactrum intermedium]|jgi:hypothetical protein|uniref:Uncharacterized protein n=1 Tax=Brucella intermedia TaxID=94625 RepID=A0ABR6AQT0_9HYPH|nr:hypothetical protein [Brucella intermedia]NYD83100.1 hypothetical protein [Brucella intermedia]